jgi:AraC family transcriptional regulator of adaptative response / DNA-3-methyladenine glycosylase II
VGTVDDEQRYQAAAAKEPRFDGVFFTAVRTTGIYCRPSCPAITPKRSNVTFYSTAAAAQQAGFRACKRCRPDASPGSPEWNVRSDLAGRAVRLIADGIVDRVGVPGLASSLGYSPRQVGRVLTAELGAGPLALARAQRARTARILVETTVLPMTEIAFAAGFASIRQFNATMLEVYDIPPSVLRERAARRGGTDGLTSAGALCLRLPFRPPIDLARMFGFLAARAVPGVEVGTSAEYGRTISLPHGPGVARLRVVPGENWVECTLVLADLRDITAAVQRCRRLLDLDADPIAISGYLASDPLVGPLAGKCPGRRSLGTVDGDEIALRAVLGQQVSVVAARRLGGRLAAEWGTPLSLLDGGGGASEADGADGAGKADGAGEVHGSGAAGLSGGIGGIGGGLTHVFPDMATIAGLDPESLPMPRSRARALVGLAAALASGSIALHPGADRDEAAAKLLALPGIGPWTVGYIRMRALSDPDAFPPGDAGVLRALRHLGHDGGSGPDAATAEPWRPWRSYAVHHLWATLEQQELREIRDHQPVHAC